jgi:hypothetical protein
VVTAKQATPRVVILLLLLGAVGVSVRNMARRERPMAVGDSIWQLSYNADFHARKSGAKVRVSFPLDTRHSRVFSHRVLNADLTTEQMHSAHGETRDILVRAPKTGVFHLTAQVDIHLSERPGWRANLPDGKLTTAERAHFLSDEKGIQVSDPVVHQTLERLRGGLGSTDELVERIFEYCDSDLGRGGDSDPQDAAAVLAKGIASPVGRARAMVALCRAARVPARLVTGFEIKIGANIQPQTWVEILSGDRWEPYDPWSGFSREMPYNFIPVRRGAVDVIRTTEATDLTTKFAIARMPPPAGSVDLEQQHPWDILDLTRLPVDMHKVLALILLLPLGALVTAVVRTIIGLRTFGTFTPTLLALSFVFNDWRTGLVVFVAVMILGFSSRHILDRLKLLLVPRLGIILTLVVLCMVFSISTLDYFGRTPSATTVLLPMVILTMLVERFYVTTEEDSLHFAVQLLIGTIAMAFVVYALLCWETVGHTLLIYPELHCFTVVALILVGRYTGYRWTELWRFRDTGRMSEEGSKMQDGLGS